jgi:hypothetical protein
LKVITCSKARKKGHVQGRRRTDPLSRLAIILLLPSSTPAMTFGEMHH